MIRLLLIDDHPVVRSGYRRLLELDGSMCVIAEANDAQQGEAMLNVHAVDVVISDVSMPEGDVWRVLSAIAKMQTAPKGLVCSMHDDAMLVHRCLQAGAQGFVTKNSPPDELIAAVQAVDAGQRYISRDVEPLAPSQRDELQRVNSLTQREREVWRLLSLGMSAAECATALSLSHKTVANYQTLIKEKLQVSTTSALVRLAQRHQLSDALALL